MNETFKVKQISRLYESCNQCGLPTLTCICNLVSPISTLAKFWILVSEREFYRPSSTGRLLKLINPASTELFLWERTSPPLRLIENITNYKGRTYLLFPTESEDNSDQTPINTLQEGENAYIIIDGTWKEARKIFRKSDYLKDLSLVTIKPEHESEFTLRRGSVEGTLCTIEVAKEILRITGETEYEIIVERYFNLFQRHYKAGASSHQPK